MFMTLIKVARNHIFLKIYETTLIISFFAFPRAWPKPKRNHQMASSRVKTRSTQNHTFVKYSGVIFLKKEKYRYPHRQSEHVSQNNLKISLIFHIISSFSPQFHVFFLQPYPWLKSYDCHGSFGTKMSGSLQCYEFCLHAILFLLLIQKLPCKPVRWGIISKIITLNNCLFSCIFICLFVNLIILFFIFAWFSFLLLV